MRFALLGATAMALAGCSSDSSRLGDAFGSDRMATGSTGVASLTPPDQIGGGSSQGGYQPPRAPVSNMPRASSIQSSQLPPPSMPSRPVYSAPSTPSPHLSSAAPRSQVATTASATGGLSGPWTAAGGTPITVGQGDTATVLSNRYGVPQDALLKVNGLSSASQIQPGTRLTIPVYSISNNDSPAKAAPAHTLVAPPAASARAAKPEPMKTAKAPELTKAKQAELAKQEAKAKALEAAKLKAAQAKPDRKLAEKPAAEPVKPVKTAKTEKPAAEQRRQQVDATPTNTVQPDVDVKPSTPAADDKPEFRWPARGRIIQGFKSGGNDGINIAVPEGTSVKAAESGVVAYAGSELKGYGNLVLIRHPNGYVSAYANNGELNVKRGETVKARPDDRQIRPVRQCRDPATALRTTQRVHAGRSVELPGRTLITGIVLLRLPRDT